MTEPTFTCWSTRPFMSRSKATNSRRWLWLRRCSVHASRCGYCPSERPAIFPRAVGNGRSALLVTGTGSHSLSGLGNVGSRALQFALQGVVPPISLDPHPPGPPTTLTIACPPALTWMCSTVTRAGLAERSGEETVVWNLPPVTKSSVPETLKNIPVLRRNDRRSCSRGKRP
jgi:hypothetical protein